MRVGIVLPCRLADPLPSTRVQLVNVMPVLAGQGLEFVVLHETSPASEQPTTLPSVEEILGRRVQVVIFQKVYGPAARRLALALRKVGVKCVFMVCDRVVPSMAEATDATLCVTAHLAGLYPSALQSRVHVVHDGIERIDVHKTTHRGDCGSARQPLKAVVVTSARLDHLPVLGRPPAWLRVVVVGDYPSTDQVGQRIRAHWRSWQAETGPQRLAHLAALCSRRIIFRPWSSEGVYRELLGADIGLIPVNCEPAVSVQEPAPSWSVKSENRLTLKMSIGLPVVASPVPSYLPVLADSRCGLLAGDRRQWLQALETLRDPVVRQEMGRAARARAVQSFSLDLQARRLAGVLASLIEHRGGITASPTSPAA